MAPNTCGLSKVLRSIVDLLVLSVSCAQCCLETIPAEKYDWVRVLSRGTATYGRRYFVNGGMSLPIQEAFDGADHARHVANFDHSFPDAGTAAFRLDVSKGRSPKSYPYAIFSDHSKRLLFVAPPNATTLKGGDSSDIDRFLGVGESSFQLHPKPRRGTS